jgi:regulator of protease activity HflC (stomatin/prohibitin superfamily)
LVRESSRSVKTAEEFFDNETQQRIQTSMSEAVIAYMHPKGIIVEEVMVRDVVLPEVIQTGVKAKKVREQKAQEQEAELTRYKTEQQQQVEKAKADKEASEMEAEKTKIVADAKAYAFRTEAEAKAKALQIEGESIRANPDVIKMRAVETWDGSLPKFFGGNADFLFTPDMLLNPKN